MCDWIYDSELVEYYNRLWFEANLDDELDYDLDEIVILYVPFCLRIQALEDDNLIWCSRLKQWFIFKDAHFFQEVNDLKEKYNYQLYDNEEYRIKERNFLFKLALRKLQKQFKKVTNEAEAIEYSSLVDQLKEKYNLFKF